MCVKSQIIIDDPPDCRTVKKMEFHLVYDGDLLRSSGNSNRRTWEKHSIRRHLHEQLKKLWETHPALKYYASRTVATDEHGDPISPEIPFLEYVARGFSRAGVGFIPLMTVANGLVCKLEVLLLRPEAAGEIVDSAGDIDNRMKTFIDALRIPSNASEMKRREGDVDDPNPMYCLLEDDKLITSLKVEADRLLFTRGDSDHEAILVIRVGTAQIDPFGSPWELHL